MGCGSSKPHVKDHGTTSAASHRASRTRPGDERSQYDIGPGYKAVKHLGAYRGARGRGCQACGGACSHSCPLALRCASTHFPPLQALGPRAAQAAPAACCSRSCVFSAAGQGGTGDTWHFKDLKNGRDVAVKFIKRPLPKVLQTNILREFTASLAGATSAAFLSAWLGCTRRFGCRPTTRASSCAACLHAPGAVALLRVQVWC